MMDSYVRSLSFLLGQGRDILVDMDETFYRKRHENYSGTIGEHLRHITDHVQAFLTGLSSGVIRYDNRVRGSEIEFQLEKALELIDSQIERLGQLGPEEITAPVSIEVFPDGSSPAEELPSTARRELAFLISHTVHHYALLGSLLSKEGFSLPEDFGLAPATIRYIKQK